MVHEQNVGEQNIARKEKCRPFCDREDKMPILSKHIIYCTDGQVN